MSVKCNGNCCQGRTCDCGEADEREPFAASDAATAILLVLGCLALVVLLGWGLASW